MVYTYKNINSQGWAFIEVYVSKKINEAKRIELKEEIDKFTILVNHTESLLTLIDKTIRKIFKT